MARIPLLFETDQNLPDDSRSFLAETGKARGKMINLYRALANRPAAGKALSDLIRTVYRSGSTLAPKEAELAYLTATVVNDCYY
jgi:alkylhydroperoxidase family enzyme